MSETNVDVVGVTRLDDTPCAHSLRLARLFDSPRQPGRERKRRARMLNEYDKSYRHSMSEAQWLKATT